MKSILTFSAFLFLATSVFSQNFRENQYSIDFRKSSSKETAGKVLGNLYINEDFSVATISNYDKNTPLRYNPYKDEMEFMKGDAIYYLNKHEGISVDFKSEGKVYVIRKHKYELKYFVLAQKGELSFLVKERVKFIAATQAVDSYGSSKAARYSRSRDEFYFANKHGKILSLPKKKKQLIKLFSGHNSGVKSFIKKNKINPKKQKDLVKLFKFLNESKS
ncbi:MAG: hypothetical protein JXR05_15945 [Flavobacteriaceae bacterium]